MLKYNDTTPQTVIKTLDNLILEATHTASPKSE